MAGPVRMPDDVRMRIDGVDLVVARGSTVAAALLRSGASVMRRSVSGQPRAPLCGMGVCQECRVTIDGVAHQRSCMILVKDGLDVRTGGGT